MIPSKDAVLQKLWPIMLTNINITVMADNRYYLCSVHISNLIVTQESDHDTFCASVKKTKKKHTFLRFGQK